MLSHTIAACSLLAASLTAALPVLDQVPLLFQQDEQHPAAHHPLNAEHLYSSDTDYVATFGASHLSEWCALSKQHFLRDLKANKAHDWVVVTGNEAGGWDNIIHVRACRTADLASWTDLDSLVSAIALAYDLAHTKHVQQKAVALLQVENSAIDLRPENKLALEKSRMERGHKDLLGGQDNDLYMFILNACLTSLFPVLEELPYPPQKVGSMIKGLMLVDHNQPLS